MFHKKVHPEGSNTEEQFNKSHKCQIKKNSIDSGYNTGALAFQDKYNKSPRRSMLKKEITNLNKTQEMLNSSGLNKKREHWIKTDADCKYIPTTFIIKLVNIQVPSIKSV